MNDIINLVIHGDCRDIMKEIPNEFISSCVTDPPYSYEFIGHDNRDKKEIQCRKNRISNSSNNTLIEHILHGSGLSEGMRNEKWCKENRDNILEYQQQCLDWEAELFRVCRPGASVVIFNSTRTVAHVQVALEQAGFYTRDIIVYRRASGIPKGLNLKRKLEKQSYYNRNVESLHSCLRNEQEAICVLRKPLKNNYLQTYIKYGTGLSYTKMENGGFRSNIIRNIKKDAPLNFNIHTTIKPLNLMISSLDVFVLKNENAIVLDPFSGSGTTLVAAKKVGINFFGTGTEPKYIEIINKRLELSQQINRRRA